MDWWAALWHGIWFAGAIGLVVLLIGGGLLVYFYLQERDRGR